MQLDHILIAVSDLEAAAREFESRYGLASVDGGSHWGTANRIVPLGESYLELVAVVDGDEAAYSPFGRWVASAAPKRPFGWAVRTDHLDEIARRLKLAIASGSHTTPDGRRVAWRTAGFEYASKDPALPLFIEWGADAPFPGAGGRARLERLELEGNPERLAGWLGEDEVPPPVVMRDGARRVSRVVLAADDGEIALP